jgi:ABC-type transport system involved in multi-copper enzyme maturation permease subunit
LRSPDGRTRTALAALWRKELRCLLASRALWVMLLLLSPLIGYSFIQALALYGEASRTALQYPELARGMTPLDGILVPTFGGLYLATTLLFPFVAIRLISEEKQSGALKLALQLPFRPSTLIAAKLLAMGFAWLLAIIPALSALALWRLLGGHLHGAETLNLLLGHFLYALLIVAIAFLAAALTEGGATAAIVTLAATIGSWVLDFAATGRIGWLRTVAALSLTAGLRTFERGLFVLPTALAMVVGAGTLFIITTVWLPLGRPVTRKLAMSAGVVVVGLVGGLLAAKAAIYADTTEDRRNSFSASDEAALRALPQPLAITIVMDPGDPRVADLDHELLSKLRRLVPDLSIAFGEVDKVGQFGAAGDDRYGLIFYDYAGRRESSRSTSMEEVLPLIYGMAGLKVAPSSDGTYPGYPLVADGRSAAAWFYAGLPALIGFSWWAVRRPRVRHNRKQGGIPCDARP